MATYAAMVPVRLTAAEADHCDAVAERQARGARYAGRRDAWGVGLDQSLRGHRIGNRGEHAFANWRGVPWVPSFQPQGTAPDVGKYEVKTASSHRELLTIPTTRFRRERLYVAVRAWNRYDHDVVGWCTGAFAQDRFPATQQQRGPWAHVVPYGVLHPMETLP